MCLSVVRDGYVISFAYAICRIIAGSVKSNTNVVCTRTFNIYVCPIFIDLMMLYALYIYLYTRHKCMLYMLYTRPSVINQIFPKIEMNRQTQ